MEKKWYSSKTIWGAIIALIGFLLTTLLKVDIQLPQDADVNQAVQAVQNIKQSDGSLGMIVAQAMIIVGSLLGIYGRFKAEGKIATKIV